MTSPAHAIDGDLELRDLRLARWGVDDGLPQIAVLTVVQDHDGYLWIGTQNGIARFDGVRFTIHDRHSSGADTTLASSALVDSTNRVWFGTPRGALVIENGRIQVLNRDGASIGVTAIAERTDGGMVFASESGLMTADNGRLRPLPEQQAAAYALLADGEHLWVGGIGEVRDLMRPQAAPIVLPTQRARINVISRHGEALWLGSDDGLWRVDLATGEVRRVDPALSGFAISALLWDRDGNLWIGSDNALFRYRPDGQVDRTDGDEFGVQMWIHTLLEGREGQIWIGTHRDSLMRMTGNAGMRVGQRDGLSDAFVWSLLKDRDGSLLIGTNSGVERRDADGRVHTIIRGSELPDPSIYTMAAADDGIWLGTRHGLALWRNGNVEVPEALDALRPFQINAMLRNGDNDYWIATTNGLYRYRNRQLEHLGVELGSGAARVRCLLSLGPDDLLICTEDGLRRVRNGQYEVLPWATPLNRSFVTRLAWIGPDLLGIGTMDQGLGLVRLPRNAQGHVDPAIVAGDRRLRLVDIDHGLSSRNIWTLDRVKDHLYIGSLQGVYRVAISDLPDPASDEAPSIDMQYVYAEPGRDSRSLQRLACCNGGADARSLLEGQWIWYATTDGAVRVDSTTIGKRPEPPRPHVEVIRNGIDSYAYTQSVEINGSGRNPAIEYSGLSLIDSEMIQFRYQLLGYDRDWQDAGSRRVAYYTHLPPGDFRFIVQARHPTGSWSDNSPPLRVRIVPHWYERRGLQAVAALVLLALIGTAVRRSNRLADARRDQLERAVSERTGALQRAVSKLRDANAALAKESRTDPLTGLSNRRLDLGEVMPSGALALLDLDHFKNINDRFGHAGGDVVLIELAGLLKRFVGEGDHLVRWGGEEFLLFLPGRSMVDALQACEVLRHTVANHAFPTPHGESLNVTCSIGVAEHPAAGARGVHWHGALDLADVALYRAKHSGRNRTIGVRISAAANSSRAPPPLPLTESPELEWLYAEQ